MPHIFISYVREDQGLVDHLSAQLKRAGLEVWLDREQIKPGQRWQSSIRKAIEEGAFFIACFSDAHQARSRSYANEELTLAIEELRRRPTDRAWFIPVLLNKGAVPDRPIGAGETLRDIQWVDLRTDWNRGVSRLLEVMGLPQIAPEEVLAELALPHLREEVMRALSAAVREGRCTPIIGGQCCPAAAAAVGEIVRQQAREVGCAFREDEDVAQITEQLETVIELEVVKQRIAGRLSELRIEPGKIYRRLAALPFPLYLTTSYDYLLSQVLALQGRPPSWGLCPWYEDIDFRFSHSRRNVQIEPTEQRPLIFHLFGQLAIPNSLVLLESDYRQLLSALARDTSILPARVAASLVRGPVMLLGFHSRDLQLREFLHCVAPLLRRNRSGLVLQLSPRDEIESLSLRVPREELMAAADNHFREITSYYGARRTRIFWGSPGDLLAKLGKKV